MSSHILHPWLQKNDRFTSDGVQYIPFKSQVLVSLGVPSFDLISGGGIPLGTILLLEEPHNTSYAEFVMKHFLAQGVMNQHATFIASLDCDPYQMVASLPGLSLSQATNIETLSNVDEEMNIAWRYQGMPKVTSSGLSKTSNQCYDFDTSKLLPQENLIASDITYWECPGDYSSGTCGCQIYENLLSSIRDFIDKKINKKEKGVIRIILKNIGSALWSCSELDLPKFFYQLRNVVQNSDSVAFVTIPPHLIKEPYVIDRCEHICHMVLAMESFEESDALFQQYKGLIKFKKVPTVNSLSSNQAHYCDLGINFLKKKFIVEVLHLPPDLETNTQREQDDF